MNLIYKLQNPLAGFKSFTKILFLALFPACLLQAQNIQPRLNHGALLEPQGKIINGAGGKDLRDYQDYWNVMHAGNKPLTYLHYIPLDEATSDWADGLKSILLLNPAKFQIPQIDLALTSWQNGGGHYEQDVADGLYDNEISMFIDGLQTLATPAYVRIGFGFNNIGNGYVPDSYKQAFIRITNMIRARGLEVATVWDLALDGVTNYIDYYPGNEYVDWWGLDAFETVHFTDAIGTNYLASASAHNKPVMIGECFPRHIGVLNGQQSWNDWFAPFFAFIHNNPQLKSFNYRNMDAATQIFPSDWGDGRLQQNAIVGNNFANEMDSLPYLHAFSERDFRQTLGYTDNIAPATPGAISVVHLGYPLQLNWSPVTDPSGLSHYVVYKQGVLADYAIKLPYIDKNIAAGDAITYAISAMDRAGNESPKTAGLLVNIPTELNKTLNGEFDEGTHNWMLQNFTSAISTMKIDTNSVISGRNSCKVTVSQITPTGWHIQLQQWLPVNPGRKYKITFKAKATVAKEVILSVQQGASPFNVLLMKGHNLTTNIQTFTDSVSVPAKDLLKLEFMLGTAGLGDIWIDDVSIIETSPVPNGIEEQENHNLLLRNYPNPFNNSTRIVYQVKEQGVVSLKIYDVMGKEVATLVNDKKGKGEYSVDWNAVRLANGIYFCILQTGSFSKTTKLISQK